MNINPHSTTISPDVKDNTKLIAQREFHLGAETVAISVQIPHLNYSLYQLELASLERARHLLTKLIEAVEKTQPPPSPK